MTETVFELQLLRRFMSKPLALFKLLRVYQWTKNLLVFAGLVFAQQLGDTSQLIRSIEAFVAFCLASSAMYVLNDILDCEKDRAHPAKRNRPLASGLVKRGEALILFAVLFTGALLVGWRLGAPFLATIMGYLLITVLYTLKLKDLIILDVLIIAIGFVIRAMAGAIALSVSFSNWLVVCTLFLALFLGLSKRRNEITMLEEGAISHRAVLQHYNLPYVDSLLVIVASATLITYTIYTCSPEVVTRLGTDKLYLTLPFVVYGLFRYFFIVHIKTEGGDPSMVLIKDWPMGLTVFLWGVTCLIIIYWKMLF